MNTERAIASRLHHDVTYWHPPGPRIKAALVSPDSTIRHESPSRRLCARFFSCRSFLGWPPPCQPHSIPSRSTIMTDLIHPWRRRCPSRVVNSLTKCVFFAFMCARPGLPPDLYPKFSYFYGGQGLVAFGFIPSKAKDSTGDTLGGIGSAARLKFGTFKAKKDGTFTGTFIAQPDRGFNVCVHIPNSSASPERGLTFSAGTTQSTGKPASMRSTSSSTHITLPHRFHSQTARRHSR
jgi:hypothetical protein